MIHAPAPQRKLIIITGHLAAGKSTFARLLSSELAIPCLVKDDFKSALCAGVEPSGRADSSRFSAITFDAMLYVAERLIETDHPLIIEGNFVPHGVKETDEAGAIKALLEKYRCPSLTFKFVGDTGILHGRFIERDKTPGRGRANVLGYEPSFDEFDLVCRQLGGFDLGEDCVTVDGTDFGRLDFRPHIEAAQDFIHK